jgi:hypothetical protein
MATGTFIGCCIIVVADVTNSKKSPVLGQYFLSQCAGDVFWLLGGSRDG